MRRVRQHEGDVKLDDGGEQVAEGIFNLRLDAEGRLMPCFAVESAAELRYLAEFHGGDFGLVAEGDGFQDVIKPAVMISRIRRVSVDRREVAWKRRENAPEVPPDHLVSAFGRRKG